MNYLGTEDGKSWYEKRNSSSVRLKAKQKKKEKKKKKKKQKITATTITLITIRNNNNDFKRQSGSVHFSVLFRSLRQTRSGRLTSESE